MNLFWCKIIRTKEDELRRERGTEKECEIGVCYHNVALTVENLKQKNNPSTLRTIRPTILRRIVNTCQTETVSPSFDPFQFTIGEVDEKNLGSVSISRVEEDFDDERRTGCCMWNFGVLKALTLEAARAIPARAKEENFMVVWWWFGLVVE